MRSLYINCRGETVDEVRPSEFPTARALRKEAGRLVAEYRMSDPSAEYYVSTRACANWKE